MVDNARTVTGVRAGLHMHEGGVPVDNGSKLFTSKVSRRKLVQAGGAAAGALAVAGAKQSMQKNEDLLREARQMLESQVADVIRESGGNPGTSNGIPFSSHPRP